MTHLLGYEWRRAFQAVPKAWFGNPSKPTILAVATVLETYADPDGRNARPGSRRLSDDSGCNIATVLAALQWLRAHGWLAVTDEGGGRRAPCYRFMVPDDLRATEPSATAAELWTGERATGEEIDETDEPLRAAQPEFARGSTAQTYPGPTDTNSWVGPRTYKGRAQTGGPEIASDGEVAARYEAMSADLKHRAPGLVDRVRELRDEHPGLPSRLVVPDRPALRAVPDPLPDGEVDPIDAATIGWRNKGGDGQ